MRDRQLGTGGVTVRIRRLTCVLALLASMVLLASCGSEPKSSSKDAAPEPSATAAVDVAVFPSIQRLVPRVDVDGMPSEIRIEAARGEREGAQLVAWTRKQGVTARVVLQTGALTGPGGTTIPAASVRAFIEQAMQVQQGSPAGRSGEYVDPLVPARGRDVTMGDGARLLAWIDVAVPLRARPGSYSGEVAIAPATKSGTPLDGVAPLATVPVTLTVRAATIPHVPTLGSSIGFDASQVIRFEKVDPGSAELRAANDAYAAELAAARLSIADVGTLPPGTMPGHRGLPGDAAYLDRVFGRRGVASVRIPFYLDHPFGDPLGRDRAAAVRYLRAAARWARSKGWMDRAYVYAIDEPDESRAGEVRELHELVHEADPALRLLVTREASAQAFRGSVDIWTPNISDSRFHPIDVARERLAGRDTWWYPSITTWQPYPSMFIDELRPAPRALGWLAYRHGVRGILYWSATHWHEVDDPYRESDTFHDGEAVGNGDGVLVYPGGPIGLPGEVVPSVRLFQLRDGIEDHDLLTLARCGTPAQRQAIARQLAVVAPSMTSFGPTGAQVAQLRTTLFATIDACNR